MMYHMKSIINHNYDIVFPDCMYRVKNLIEFTNEDDINIGDQVNKFLKGPNTKMSELEERQDQLLKKLDTLYERVKTISVHCKSNNLEVKVQDTLVKSIQTPEEVVLVVNPDSLPWYLNIVINKSQVPIKISWHIHSSVPNEKVPKIKAFVKTLQSSENNSKINLRLIFKCVSADTELKFSSLAVPIVGNVNIIRYLALVYPSAIPYDHSDYYVDSLLDICHILERTPEKNKEALVNKLFGQSKNWIYGNEYCIVDLAAYNIMKQWKTIPKYVPKSWFDSCERMCV